MLVRPRSPFEFVRPVLLLLMAGAFSSCGKLTAPIDRPDPWELGDIGPSSEVLPGLPAVCGPSTEASLIADMATPVGTVEVAGDGENLYVVYRTHGAWPIAKTALAVASSAEDIPRGPMGDPRPGDYPLKSSHDGVHEVVWPVSLASLNHSGEVAIAAFAELDGGRGAWALDFTHAVGDCAAADVDAGGATVRAPGGRASVEIGPGALTSSVAITVEPASLVELLAYVAERDASEAAVYGLIPIPGAIWRFGPHGLEFETPVNVALAYDESSLPDGVSEDDLGVFVVNGVIPFGSAASVVDADNDVVSASIDHFSYVFVGYDPPRQVDLEVSALALSGSSEARVGVPMDFVGAVTNRGTDASRGGTFTYQAFGDVVLGDLPPSCSGLAGPIAGAVAVSCEIPPQEAGATNDVEPFQLVVRSEGEVTVRAMVSAAPGDLDPNESNNERGVTVFVGPVTTDLAVTRLEPAGPLRVGEVIEYGADVTNFGPDVAEGAVFTWAVVGDVVGGEVSDGCLEVDAPVTVSVVLECRVDRLEAGASQSVPVLHFTVRAEGAVTVRAVVIAAPGEVDPNESNNERDATVFVGPVTTDLAVTELHEPAVPARIGEVVEYGADVTNFGPDVADGAVFTWVVVGGVVGSEISDGCREIDAPSTVSVALECTVDRVEVGASQRMPVLRFTAGSEGAVTVRAIVTSAPGDLDPNESNNERGGVLIIN